MKNSLIIITSLLIVLCCKTNLMAQTSSGCETIKEGAIDQLESLITQGVFYSNVATFDIIEKDNLPGVAYRNFNKPYDSCTYNVDVEIKANECDAEEDCQVEREYLFKDCSIVDATWWSKSCSAAELALFGDCAHKRTIYLECKKVNTTGEKRLEALVNFDNPYYYMNKDNPIQIYPAATDVSFYRGDTR